MVLVAGSAAALVLVVSAAAAPGDLDPSFAGKGWVRTFELRGGSGPYFPGGAEEVALQPDGKILAVGDLEGGSSSSAVGVFRYTPSGDLDRSFGQGGWAATALGSFAHAHAVALQRDGKIVLAGEAPCSHIACFALVRYLPNGTLDSRFGVGGVVRTGPRWCGCHFRAVEVLHDGRIVAAGRMYNEFGQTFAVARYLSDGRPDGTFSSDGIASVDVGGSYEGGEALAVQRDGKVLIAGGQRFTVLRLRRNGRLDRSFSRDGRVTVSFGRERWDTAHAIQVRRDGRILIAGESRAGQVGPSKIALARLTGRGTLDRSFGRRGRVLTEPAPAGGFAKAMLIQSDDRFLVAGVADAVPDSTDSDWVLARYRARGTLDRTFGRSGIVVTSFGTGTDWAGALARQADGKIVVGGEIYRDQAVARYLAR
jgi:uncharacterized delta-60 repeat protein